MGSRRWPPPEPPLELVTGLSLLDALARSPQALALLLESCGKVALEHAGAILSKRVSGEE